MAFLELVTLLPPGAPSQTRLARHGQRLVVLRELKEGTACFYPDATPYLVTVEEVGELQGKRHALFPYVPGVSLRDLVDAFAALKKPVPLGLVGGVVLAGARALAAHQPPRAHGGLHDGALQVAFTGETYVLDFGAPRVTRFKALGRDSLAADVFALGGVVHAALTGYQGPYVNPPAGLPRPSLSHPEATPGLDDVVLRALSPQVPGRQPDVGTFARELAAVVPEPWAPEDLHALVNSLFQDRVRLLQSLSGLTEALPGPGLGEEEVDLATASHGALPAGPIPPIPMRTEPGGFGDGTSPGVRLPWLVDEAPEEVPEAAEDGGTQPRIEVREERTSPGAPAPVARPSRPAPGEGSRPTADRLPQVSAARPSAANLRAMSDETEAGQGRPRASAANLRVTSDETDAGQRAPRPSAANLRAMSPPADLPLRPSRPGGADSRAPGDEPVRGAARPPPPEAADAGPFIEAEDTAARPRPSGVRASLEPAPAEDTSPRARGPVPPEDTSPRAWAPAEALGPRNTTTHERLRAAGQERVPTPPAGVPALELGEEIESQPTAVRPRVVAAVEPEDEVDPVVHADTMQKLPAVPAPKRRGRGLIAVLLVLVAGLGALLAMKEGQLPAPEPLAGWLGLGVDAGSSEGLLEPADAGAADDVADAGEGEAAAGPGSDGGDAVGDAGLVAVVGLDGSVADAGGEVADAGAADGGAEDAGLSDAGALLAPDGGAVVDGGTPDAGAAAKTKAPPKKKKRRR